MGNNDYVNKYNSTPRKVFDKYIDRMAVRRKRDLDDHRADLKAIFHRIINLEQALQDLAEHVAQHCLQIEEEPREQKHPPQDPEELE